MKMMTLHYILTATSLTLGMILQSKFDMIGKIEDTVDMIPVIGGPVADLIGMAK